MKKLISFMVVAVVLALFGPPACGRQGPDAPPDTTPPTVTATSPQYGEQNVPINGTIAVTFSEDMDAATINNETILLAQSGNPVSGTVTCDGKTATFTPAANLSPNSAHTLTVTVGVKDRAGNAMVAPFFCSFTTGTGTVSSSFTVTPSAGANGSISPGSPQQVPYNGTVTFTVTPAAGYVISSVEGCGGTLNGNSFTTGPVTGNCTVTASFKAGTSTTTYTITASAGANGSIDPSGSVTVNAGESRIFTMIPGAGYHVSNVVVDGSSIGVPSSYTFNNVAANHSIAVSFAANAPTAYTITASAGPNGSITPSGSVPVQAGASQSFTIKANDGYRIATVLVDGKSVGAPSSYTFKNVTANHTISATFKKR